MLEMLESIDHIYDSCMKCVYANSVVFLATIQMHTPLSIILGKSYRVQLSTHPIIP
jgi:hypothetical protein